MAYQSNNRPRNDGRSILSKLLVLVAFCFSTLPSPSAMATVVAIKNVNVIGMNPNVSKKLRKRQTVVIEDGKVVALGKANQVKVPSGAEVINGRGKYLLPGLYDMHAHGEDVLALPEDFSEQDLYSLYLANGITGIYDPWGFKQAFKWRQAINRGRVIGPRLYFSSPGVNNNHHSTPDEVEASVRKWARQGYTEIKTHGPITFDKFERLHEVARELGLRVIGHAIRPGFPIQTTLDQGQAMIAHIEEILSTEVPFDRPGNFVADLDIPLADVVDSRVWVTTTVGTYRIIAKTVADATFEELLSRPEMQYLPPTVHSFWRDENIYRQDNFLKDPDLWSELLDVKLYIANELKERGSLDRLLIGSDSGIPLLIPGFGLHDEIRLLVQGGLTPWQALLTATYNPTVFLGSSDEAGTVELGKRADFLMVKKNPLRKISNLKRVTGVMVNGIWLPSSTLDSRLEELANRWKN